MPLRRAALASSRAAIANCAAADLDAAFDRHSNGEGGNVDWIVADHIRDAEVCVALR